MIAQRGGVSAGGFFVSAANAQALAAVVGLADWPGGKLVLIGPEGCGHDASGACLGRDGGGEVISAAKLLETDLHHLAQRPIAVENADRIAGDREAEVRCFICTICCGRGLLVTPPAAAGWGLVGRIC